MENRKQLIDKELRLEKEKIQKEINLLKEKKEDYSFDHKYMDKQIRKSKFITTISFVATYFTTFLSFPWSLMYTNIYALLENGFENIIQLITGKNFLRIGKNKTNNLDFFSTSQEIVSNYKEVLDINFEIEKLNIKNKIVENAININKEDYRVIHYNSTDENNKNIDLIAATNTIRNNNFFQGDERKYSKKLLTKNIVLKLFGSTALCILTLPNGSIPLAVFIGTFSFVSSQAIHGLIDIDKLYVPKICAEENDRFLNQKQIDINATDLDKINIDSLTDNIIEEESYKMLNNYNKNIESIVRKKKIDEYYKKKEEIIRTLNSNKKYKIEKPKVKVLQKYN